MAAKREELVKEREAKAAEVLSKEQQEKYTKLKGKPFDVSQLQGPGRRGGAGQ
jgi:DNA topoisomerase IA